MVPKIKFVYLFFYFRFLTTPADCATKTWRFSNDISNPINWENGKAAEGCGGVFFPRDLGSVGSVFGLSASEMVLPVDGELEIEEGGYIEISEHSELCIKLKQLEFKRWLSPSSWLQASNKAVPHAEQVPCAYDDVIFPSDAAVSVFLPELAISINSIRIAGRKLTNSEWQTFLSTDYGNRQFQIVDFRPEAQIYIEEKKCRAKSGCACHNSDDVRHWVCKNLAEIERTPCFRPVAPWGHCHKICGGVVKVEVGRDFEMGRLEARLPTFEDLDVHVSKIDRDKVQIVFVEKAGYTGRSSKAAKNFHDTLMSDSSGFGIKWAEFEGAGIPLVEGSTARTAFAIILGTLGASMVLFLWICVVYVGPLKDYDFGSRLPISQFSFGNRRPFLFRKFEEREGEMSLATSMMSLAKAFDNPMYGEPSSKDADGAEVLAEMEDAELEDVLAQEGLIEDRNE